MINLSKLNIIDKITLVNRHVSGNLPEYIVIHFTGNKMSAVDNAEIFFNEYTGLSYHYIVDSENIVRTAFDEDSTFHINDSSVNKVTNHNSISIAICVNNDYEVDSNTVNNLIDLTKSLSDEYEINCDSVLRHYDCSGKNCPSCWRENNWNEWWNFKKRLNSDDVSISTVQLTGMNKILDNTGSEFDLSNVSSQEFIGIFTPSERLPLYDSPSISGRLLDFYEENEAVEFDSIFKDEELGHSWISYLSFNGHRRYLLISSDHSDVIKGNIDHNPSPNIDTENDERAELGIISKEDTSGIFIPSSSLRVRSKPTTNASHISTIYRNKPFSFTGILKGNNFIWLSLLNSDMGEWYVPIASYDSLTGEEGILHGRMVRK